MQYVKVARHFEGGRWKGYELDVDHYLERLPTISLELPNGARQFATDPEHYDFAGKRCVKDLALSSTLDVEDGTLHLYFRPNEWKHQTGLRVVYHGVATCDFEPSGDSDGYGTVMLDELLPTERGVAHEFFMTGGILRVDAEDLEATWSE